MILDLLGDLVDQLGGVDGGAHGDLCGVEPVREGLQAVVELAHVLQVLLHLGLNNTRKLLQFSN